MKKSWLLASTLAVSLTLVACKPSNQPSQTGEVSKNAHPAFVEHEGTPLEGGTFKRALVSAAPFKGMLMDELSSDSTDSVLAEMVDEPLIGSDINRKLDDSGLATIEFDIEGKTATIKLKSKDFKWSDGQPVTIDDYIFTITAMGHKDYPGVRYDDDFKNIIGMEDYHNEKADSVSGLEKIDDLTVKVHFQEMSPSMRLGGGSVPNYVAPKHIFESIPVANWEESEYVRSEKVVGLGPWKIESIVPGQSVTFVPNEHYYLGKPKLDKAVVEIVSPQNIVSEMKAGHYDYAELPISQYETYKDLTNVTLLGSTANTYEYIAFHLGKFNSETNKNDYDPNSKMADKALRQAMGYALDIDTAGKQLYNGLLRNAKTLTIPFFGDLHDSSIEGYTYNPEKAKKILDDAGYKDVDGDGKRENPKGEKLTINFAARTRDDANEGLVTQYVQWWNEIGLDVQLYTGRTLEVNLFYDKIQADDPEIDVFAAGWSTGYDPNPAGTWGPDAKFNFSRFVSEKGNSILGKIASLEAFDDAKNVQFYKEWQEYAFDEAFAIPTLTGEKITAINKRVKYYDVYLGSGTKSPSHLLQVTAENPLASE